MGLNIFYTKKLQKRLETEVSEIDSYLNVVDIELDAGIGLDNTRLVTDVDMNAGFEDIFKQEFKETFRSEKSPCAMGGDGKGGCKKITPVMRSTVNGLNLDGLLGQASMDVAKYGDLHSGRNNLNQQALPWAQIFAPPKVVWIN